MDDSASKHIHDSANDIPAYLSGIFAFVMIIAILIGVSVNALLLWVMTHKKEDNMCSELAADNEGERPAFMCKLMCLNALLLYTVLIYQVIVVLQHGSNDSVTCTTVSLIISLTISMSNGISTIYSCYQWTKISDRQGFDHMYTTNKLVLYIMMLVAVDGLSFIVMPFSAQYGSYGYLKSSHMCFIRVPQDRIARNKAIIIYWFWAIANHGVRNIIFVFAQSLILKRLLKQTNVVAFEFKDNIDKKSISMYRQASTAQTAGAATNDMLKALINSNLDGNLLRNYLDVKLNIRTLSIRTICLILAKVAQISMFVGHVVSLHRTNSSDFDPTLLVTAMFTFILPLTDTAIILTFNPCARRHLKALLVDLKLLKKRQTVEPLKDPTATGEKNVKSESVIETKIQNFTDENRSYNIQALASPFQPAINTDLVPPGTASNCLQLGNHSANKVPLKSSLKVSVSAKLNETKVLPLQTIIIKRVKKNKI